VLGHYSRDVGLFPLESASIAADVPALTIGVDSTFGGFAKPSTAIGSLSPPDQLPACRRLDLSFSLLSALLRCVHSTPR
jgi:hypothetical protein